ncbi:hypothetical protein ABZS66_23405 [Dactylosporangium sp. NPDC005572]|uniref:hypothetical protein n=1 Tax=Dactylosporangium sp. NPDC005572 TaxID=3156889 RepID=UPI0033AEBC2A
MIGELRLGGVVVRVDPAVPPDEDLLPADWGQQHVYGHPLWGRTFADATRRVSVWTAQAGLLLLDRFDAQRFGDLLRFLRVGDRRDFAVRVAESADPLRDGYFAGLAISRSDEEQDHGLAEVLGAFVAAEATRLADTESVLRRRYASTAPRPLEEDPLYYYVDVPVFDSGDVSYGFGLMVEDGAVHRLWSRPVHYHK